MGSEMSKPQGREAEAPGDLLRRAPALFGEGADERSGRSLRATDSAVLWLEHGATASAAATPTEQIAVLAAEGDPVFTRFDGESHAAGDDLRLLRGPTSAANAAALRGEFDNLQPVPLGLQTSAGFGDRLGLATPGHAKAMHLAQAEGKIAPIFAQQSIREMTRTSRTAQEVMDDATWGAFDAGWRSPVGADADHQKTAEHVTTCLAAGFTFFTVDPGEYVDDSAENADAQALQQGLEALPWAELEDDWSSLKRRLLAAPLDADGVSIAFDEESLARAAVKYGAALAHTVRLNRVLVDAGRPFELELSVDETSYPTKLVEHAYVALELRRLGVAVVSLAPRFVGRFEKGVDFRADDSGDLAELTRTLAGHAAVARACGPYKLSLHSGSDKFSVYPGIAEATGGLVHLKTAGTSYLEALRVAAVHAPDIFRRALAIGHERFEIDRHSYLIGAQLSAVPQPESLSDAELPALLDDDDARQVLHVTFGSALDALGTELKALLAEHWQAHEEGLGRHFLRHLEPFVPHAGDR